MAFKICYQQYIFMCLYDFKLQPKTPQISKKNIWKPSSEAVNHKNKILSTSLRYLSIDSNYFRKFQKQVMKKKSTIKLKDKNQFDGIFLLPGWNLPYVRLLCIHPVPVTLVLPTLDFEFIYTLLLQFKYIYLF